MPDPVYAIIDQHLAARAAADRVRHDDFDAAHAQRTEALRAVHGARPTTVSGLLALARHMRSYLTQDGEPPGLEQTAADQAFACLVEACAGLDAARYPGMDRDWAEFAAYHPGFLPVPQDQPAGLLKLDLAIPLEAKRLLALAEAEFERRRLAYVGFHDPTVWPQVAANLRRNMRMDALAVVAAEVPTSASGTDRGFDDCDLALIRLRNAHEAAHRAFGETIKVCDALQARQQAGEDVALEPV